jgi:hypothetical protein
MQTATTKPAPAVAPLAPVFRTAAGRLTHYALACGYVETFENEGRAVTLWHEGGPVFHVRAHDHNKGQRLEWETFERLADARRHFDKWRTKLAGTAKFEAYLQHGKAGGPYRTERVAVKLAPMAHHKNPRLTYTASGYGARIPTEYMVWSVGRWRRVYCRIYSNNGTLYIGRGDAQIIVSIDRV